CRICCRCAWFCRRSGGPRNARESPGISESGNIFAAPTYIFLLAMFALIGFGLFRLATGQLVVPPPPDAEIGHELFTLFFLLRAFAVASAVMTGTEAISHGIPAFKRPEPHNAARTLEAMGAILGTMFLGLSVLIVGAVWSPATLTQFSHSCRVRSLLKAPCTSSCTLRQC